MIWIIVGPILLFALYIFGHVIYHAGRISAFQEISNVLGRNVQPKERRP